MTPTIRASSFFQKRYLKVKDDGVIFMETAVFGSKRRFPFGHIDYVLLSPAHLLSFQVGSVVCSIPTKPGNAQHQQAIQKFQAAVAASHQVTGGFPVEPPPARAV